jgi:signal transduction histidine kinase
MLGLLRDQETGPAAPPVQSIGDLDVLVADLRDAGVEVALRIEGTQRLLEPVAELTAYRIVQESLTNVLKHSGSARAEVAVTYLHDGVDIEVLDDGSGGRVRVGLDDGSGGHGLVGLRERTRLLGGDLEYGAVDGRGFRVSAHLPSSSLEAS